MADLHATISIDSLAGHTKFTRMEVGGVRGGGKNTPPTSACEKIVRPLRLIHRYVALSVIGHKMCNQISGLSSTIDAKGYRETSLVRCLRYYYSCCTLVILRGNQLVIFPGIACTMVMLNM